MGGDGEPLDGPMVYALYEPVCVNAAAAARGEAGDWVKPVRPWLRGCAFWDADRCIEPDGRTFLRIPLRGVGFRFHPMEGWGMRLVIE